MKLNLHWYQYLEVVVLGAFTGAASGMFGVGGGIILVPALVLLLGFTQQTAQGVSLATMVPLAIINATTYYKAGKFDTTYLPLMGAVLVGSLAAGPYGSTIAINMGQDRLKLLFALFLIAVAVGIVPKPTTSTMGLLLGVLLVGIGIRFIFAK